MFTPVPDNQQEGKKQSNFTRKFHSFKVACFVPCSSPNTAKRRLIDRLFTNIFHTAVISAWNHKSRRMWNFEKKKALSGAVSHLKSAELVFLEAGLPPRWSSAVGSLLLKQLGGEWKSTEWNQSTWTDTAAVPHSHSRPLSGAVRLFSPRNQMWGGNQS